jgi:alkanesulfonate monooxygenase SsuD/methylene tetrahydromethanopterin reductase-like flavin-dependent oxidoreductase (luciferase family)
VPVVGIHCSHEQIPPSRLLEHVREAEAAGFRAAMSSDHFSPWSERQGESGFAWSFLGAALQATELPFGVVNAPGQRYHPAIVAQAGATLCELYPGRLWVALGTGEASNEHITRDRWPPKRKRNARLRECVDVMRALFAGEVVDHDGLVTINQPRKRLEQVISAFREGGGEGKQIHLQVHLSWAEDEEEALRIAHDQWRTNVFGPPLSWDLETVEQFDEAAAHVRPEDMRDSVLVSADTERHAAWLHELAELGFEEIHLHHVGQDLGPFIQAFGERVLPELGS